VPRSALFPFLMLKLPDLERLNSELHGTETRDGKRAAVLEQFGGLERLAAGLKTDAKDGLSSREAVESAGEAFGRNEVVKPRGKSFFVLVWERLKDVTMLVLSGCAMLSLALGIAFPEEFFDPDCECVVVDSTGWVEGVAIIIAVLLVVMVGAFQDWDKERRFRALGSADRHFVRVVREGREKEVETTELVVGDLVVLEIGKDVPADGYVVFSGDLKVDESSMTGESEPVAKDEDPWLLSGTAVTGGRGTMLVGATGERTEWGKMMQQMQEMEVEDTPLQIQLNAMVVAIGRMGLVGGVMTFFILGIFWTLDTYALIGETAWSNAYLRGLVDALVIGISVLVVGIPEGLPLAVVISLAYSMKAMTKDNLLVRHLEASVLFAGFCYSYLIAFQACETMGGATNICSDKTGTLTQNKMTVVRGWIGGKSFEKVPWGDEVVLSPEFWDTFKLGIALNTTASRQKAERGEEMKVVGNPTEIALLDMVDAVEGTQQYFDALRRERKRDVALQVPFSSTTKRMTTACFEGDTLRCFVKGAPDQLIDEASLVAMADGEVTELTADEKRELQSTVKTLSESGYRALFVGYYDLPAESFRNVALSSKKAKIDLSNVEARVAVQAVVGIEDPVRPEVPPAIERCVRAGITVRMVTGDYLGTAVKIAEECGIKTAKGVALSGGEFREMSDQQLDEVLPQLQVLARAQPADKLRLVERLKALDQIVAVTGDGTNDAPALSKADVGFAMGIAGTDVAKEASDIVIMDDNFRSIVASVKWGRNVYESVRKFLMFQMTVNFAALLLVFVGAVSRYGAPLRAVQLLWINLIMDTLAALALATEPPSELLLEQAPHGRGERIISNIMWKHIFGQAAYQLLVLFLIMYLGDRIPFVGGTVSAQSRQHYTLVFNAFVWCQLFNELNARSIDDHQNIFRGIHKSAIFVAVMVVSAGMQAIIVEFGGNAFKVVPLEWDMWLFCMAVGVLSLPIGVLLRLLPVPKRHIADIAQFWNRKRAADGNEEPRPVMSVNQDAGRRRRDVEDEPLLKEKEDAY
jgi:Ca2+-transporting ATPase